MNLGKYLTQENNSVKMEVGNQHGKSRTWNFNIRALEIVLYFDDSYVESLVRNADWRLRVGCRGVTALVHLLIDGKEVATSTITNTTYDFPMTKDLDEELVESLGLKRSQFGEMTSPATIIGTLTKEVQKMTGLTAIPVIAVAGHDTASAVAAVPAKNEEYRILYKRSHCHSHTYQYGVQAPCHTREKAMSHKRN